MMEEYDDGDDDGDGDGDDDGDDDDDFFCQIPGRTLTFYQSLDIYNLLDRHKACVWVY